MNNIFAKIRNFNLSQFEIQTGISEARQAVNTDCVRQNMPI